MTNLPQLHDWFAGLLTPGQWVFAYIVALIVFFVLIFRAAGEDYGTGGERVGLAAAGAVTVPILLWLISMGLLHFLSFMIYLLFSGV